MGHARGQLLCLDDRECRRRSVLAERPLSQEPPDQAQCNQREPGMEQLERATNLGSPASRTGRGPPLRKPGQTTCVALQEFFGWLGSGPGPIMPAARAPPTPTPLTLTPSSPISLPTPP